MKKTWVLVADSSRARIFSAASPSAPLVEIDTLLHPESRLHEQQLTSDLPGRQANRYNGGTHATSFAETAKDHEISMFAKIISEHLQQAFNRHEFEQLIVVAAPSFLGQIRSELHPALSKAVAYELDKNLARQDAAGIRRQLPEILPSLGV